MRTFSLTQPSPKERALEGEIKVQTINTIINQSPQAKKIRRVYNVCY